MTASFTVGDAVTFAVERHAGQRYGERPYSFHLSSVAAQLRWFGVRDPEMVAAAWLHDVVEDTDTTIGEVRERFGDRVAALVWAVTNEAPERDESAYPKIAADPDATTLKLADRIANVTASRDDNPGFLAMYRAEHPAFSAALRRPGHADAMWVTLDALLA